MGAQKKKMNVYMKAGLIMLISAVAGGILGFAGALLFDKAGEGITGGISGIIKMLQMMILPLLIVLTVVSVFLGEQNIRKTKRIHEKMKAAEDEEYDLLDYEEERVGAIGLLGNICSQALCFIILSFGYNTQYIDGSAGARSSFLIACIVWIVCYSYDCFWQIRYVKVIQKAHPENKADPSSRKFQQQWLESCDEAEREIIFQSSYKTYMLLNKSIPVFLIITMITHLFLDTGVLAVVVVAVLWVMESACYMYSCVSMRKSKIN